MVAAEMVGSKKVTDAEIRKYLYKDLFKEATHVVQEFSIENGASRVDLVVISDAELHGYEIKSDVDTLKRLSGQVYSYNKVFPKMTLVVGRKHIKQAIYMVPEWWGITLAKHNLDGQVVLSQIRNAEVNLHLDAASLLKLLLKKEINVVIKSHNFKATANMTKESLARKLLGKLDETEICHTVTKTLFYRYSALNRS